MNGPTMYHLKPVVKFSDVVTPTSTMYRMKNIFSPNGTTSGTQDNSTLPNILEQKPSEGVEQLEKRQEAVLKQLNYLKEQMSLLREELVKKSSAGKLSAERTTVSPHNSTIVEQNWERVSGELVLHASPDHPPYSLMAVGQLWPGLRLRVTCHAHSSISTIPDYLDVFNTLTQAESSLHVRLIWKQMGPDCELIISPLTHCPIKGEVNLLRYFHRSVTTGGDPVSAVQLDSALDTCHRLRHAHTLRDKQLAVRALNARLGKAQWMLGEGTSVVDAAAWSALRAVSGVELSQNMNKWLGRCAAAFRAGGENTEAA